MNIINFLKKIGLLKYGAETGSGPLMGEFYGSDKKDRKEEVADPKESRETEEVPKTDGENYR